MSAKSLKRKALVIFLILFVNTQAQASLDTKTEITNSIEPKIEMTEKIQKAHIGSELLENNYFMCAILVGAYIVMRRKRSRKINF